MYKQRVIKRYHVIWDIWHYTTGKKEMNKK